MSFLEEERASGEQGLAGLVREPARFRAAGRLFLLGDLLDLEPAALRELVRRGRELFCAQLLAPEELDPRELGACEWIDAETGRPFELIVDRGTLSAYEELLSERLESWRSMCARHRAGYGCWPSTRPFEEITLELLGT
jgi:hypothetical protein